MEGARVFHDAAEAVRERQEEEEHVVGPRQLRVDPRCRHRAVAVREHAALRRAGRARGVDQRREVVLCDLVARALDRAGIVRGARAALGGQRFEVSEREHGSALDLRALLLVLDDHEDGLRVVEDVRALLRGARRVEADHDGADRHQRPVEQHPLERRPRQDAHRIPAADAPGQETVGELVDPPAGLVPAHRPPSGGGLGQVRGARPALGERGPPDRDRRPQLGLVRRDRRRHLHPL